MASPDNPASAAAPIAKSDLGGTCALGCEPGVACAAPEDTCQRGYCAFDGRADGTGNAYCTADCNDNCPVGYTCETAAHSSVRVCLAKPGRCGDGEIQGQEACDDGNANDFDACSKDCTSGPATIDASLRFGTANGTVAGALPVAAKASGCDQATVTDGKTYLTIDATFCDAHSSDRATLTLKVDNVKGVAALEVTDFGLQLGTVGTPVSSDSVASPTCPSGNCGIRVTIGSTWGSPQGLTLSIDGAVATNNQQNMPTTRELTGTVTITPTQ